MDGFAIYRLALAGLYLTTTAAYGAVFVRDRAPRGRVATGLLLCTGAAHAVYLWLHSLHIASPPVFNVFEVLGVLALTLALVYALVEFRMKERTTGVFLVAPAALFMLLSAVLTRSGAEPQPILMENRTILLHIVPVVVGYAGLTASFIFSALYLLLHQSLKRNRFGIVFDRLPSLETLGDMNDRSLQVGLLFLTLAVAVGIYLSVRTFALKNVVDPKVLLVLAGWLFFGAAFVLRRVRVWSARRVAFLTVLGYALLLVSTAATPLLSKFHGFK